MIKKIFTLATLVSMLAVSSVALAKNANQNDKHFAPPSEEAIVDGVYDVEGQTDLKVKVTVHHAKNNAKPGSGGSSLVCGLSDTDSSSVIPSAGWHLPSQVTYRLNRSSAPVGVGADNLVTIVSNAFSDWSSAVSGKVLFNRGADTFTNRAQADGQNIISWGRTSGSALAVTYTWYYSNGLVAETDTIFNSTFNWKWSDQALTPNCAYSNAYDAENILTHETGHWMGLDDTYDASFTNNTMFGYGSPTEVKKDTLTTGDLLGVNSIY